MPVYIGRFAPTPTGPLHFGSLVAALASYLDAKAHQGKWLLRIEDLDPPREDPAASERIPEQLQGHGLLWDGPVEFQSQHHDRYEAALRQLAQQGHTFPCQCSRKQLAAHSGLHHGPCVLQNTENPAAIRLAVPDANVGFTDAIYQDVTQNLLWEVGDQILKRKDDLYAYQLAVVVDDHHAGITHIVRGADLLDNTPRQIYLMQCLGYAIPQYRHIPLVTNHQGQKLSKQNKAQAIENQDAKTNLLAALDFLGQTITDTMRNSSHTDILEQASLNWSIRPILPSHEGLILD